MIIIGQGNFRMKKKIVFVLASIVLICSSAKGQEAMIDKTVVKELELEKYLGKWYELARYDHRFERGLEGVSATYSMRKDGKIKVLNAGYKGSLDGKRSEAVGKAKIPDPSEPAKLKVSFFLFFYGDYFVLDLDPDYQWALIGSSSDNFLWILSRKPVIDDSLYNKLLAKLKDRGYDVDKLIKVKQKSI